MNEAYIPGRTPPPNETGGKPPATREERAISAIKNLDVTDPYFELKLINAFLQSRIPFTQSSVESLVGYVFGPKNGG